LKQDGVEFDEPV